MNKIGIIFAMREELEAVLNKMNLVNSYKIFDLEFFECEYNGKTCVLVESGMGKVNAARCTQIVIDNIKVDYILNVGVAGGVSKKVNIGDVVIGDKLIQHDFDLRPFNYERGYIPNVGKFVPCDEYLIRLASEIKLEVKSLVGTIASGDIFVTEEDMGKKINNKFDALCVEMEGASIAQICYLSHIPFLVIRSISDSPNKEANNNITFDEFLKSSADVASKFLLELIEKIA